MQRNSDFLIPGTLTATPEKDSVTDEVLWRNFKGGNDLALSILYKKHIQCLYDYGMQIHRNHDMVMKCLHDLFNGIWNEREGISSIKAVKHYLFKSLRTLLNRHLIVSYPQVTSRQGQEAFESMPVNESELNEMTPFEIIGFKNWVQSLTHGEREVIYLKFKSGFTNQQVAEIITLQVGEVDNLISKTLQSFWNKSTRDKDQLPALLKVTSIG